MKKMLRGGFVVTPRGSRRADVLLDGEKIAQVGQKFGRYFLRTFEFIH